MQSGNQLGHYRLIEQIGEGGMGVVWRARDTTLDREVAIKVLPTAVAADGERLQRFEREARLLASLNHPNIATIHGFHSEGETHFLAMELVEGEDLETRVAREPLSLERAVEIATQVARALESAHAQGVVHRDLKPANVQLTSDGDAKVLDFGLAKALAPETASGSASASPSLSPTLTSAGTVAGMILGTAAYMAPEQARGKPVDKRADLWAFGCLLYEMLTGRRCFPGETISDTLAAVLKEQPDWSQLPDGTPPAIRRLLRRCLAKDPRNRLSDAADARLDLQEAFETDETEGTTPPIVEVTRPSKWPWAIAAVAIVTAVGWTLWQGRLAPAPPAEPITLSIRIPSGVELEEGQLQNVALSPDGRHIVFVGAGEDASVPSLYLRDLDDATVVPLPDTAGAMNPFFSPDSQWIGFFGEGRIRKLRLGTSKAVTVCETPGTPRGADWGDDDRIVYSPNFSVGLLEVSGAGGTPTPLTELDPDRKERTHRWPQFALGHDVVLFTVATTDSPEFYDDAWIDAVRLSTGERTTVYEGASFARYVPTGHLILAREGFLHAVPFDIDTLTVRGAPEPVLEGVAGASVSGVVYASFSSTGLLAYVPGASAAHDNLLTWRNADGTDEPVRGLEPGGYVDPALSPDGKRLAFGLVGGRTRDIWVFDLERESKVRLTFEGDNRYPVWSPDGKRVAFYSIRAGTGETYITAADGTGQPERVTVSAGPRDMSPDGTTLILENEQDLMTLRLDTPAAEVVPFLDTPAGEQHARFSPDGNWVAYSSNETGNYEIYVRPFPGPGGRWQVSNGGGILPKWSADGRQIHYRLSRAWWVVDVDPANAPGRPFRTGTPRLVRSDLTVSSTDLTYGLALDGSAIIQQLQTKSTAEEIRVIVHWLDDITRRVPL